MMTIKLAAAIERTHRANAEHVCQNCGTDWRGSTECPHCGWSALVFVCSWCPDARERTLAEMADGNEVSHGICAGCQRMMEAES